MAHRSQHSVGIKCGAHRGARTRVCVGGGRLLQSIWGNTKAEEEDPTQDPTQDPTPPPLPTPLPPSTIYQCIIRWGILRGSRTQQHHAAVDHM